MDKTEFVIIKECGLYDVCYNKHTKVMYAVSSSYSCTGVFTLLVNADGTPMLYEEEN